MDVLMEKAGRAVDRSGCRTVAVVGGVAANGELRRRFRAMAEREGLTIVVPEPSLCTDNAAMVAWNGCSRQAMNLPGPGGPAVRSRAQWPAYRQA
jgi:N6-L-threonylcarbamoyladenine synthase